MAKGDEEAHVYLLHICFTFAYIELDYISFPRNPDGDTKPWCYVYKRAQITWEFCSLPTCLSGTNTQTDSHSSSLTVCV